MSDKELLNDLQALSKENKHLKEFKEIIENEVKGYDIPTLLESVSTGDVDVERLVRKIETIKNLVVEYELTKNH